MSSTDVFVAIAFYVTAIAMVVGAVGMVLNRDMIRSAMLLILVLSGVAVMYVLLSADFLAIAQLLVYVGAIMILMLFAIMLTPESARPAGRLAPGAADQRGADVAGGGRALGWAWWSATPGTSARPRSTWRRPPPSAPCS